MRELWLQFPLKIDRVAPKPVCDRSMVAKDLLEGQATRDLEGRRETPSCERGNSVRLRPPRVIDIDGVTWRKDRVLLRALEGSFPTRYGLPYPGRACDLQAGIWLKQLSDDMDGPHEEKLSGEKKGHRKSQRSQLPGRRTNEPQGLAPESCFQFLEGSLSSLQLFQGLVVL